MEPIRSQLETVQANLDAIKEGSSISDQVLSNLIESYDSLSSISLEEVKIDKDVIKDFHKVNERIKNLCKERLFDEGSEKEVLFLTKVTEVGARLTPLLPKEEFHYFAQLPSEVQLKILDELDHSDLKSVVEASKYLSEIGRDPQLFKSKELHETFNKQLKFAFNKRVDIRKSMPRHTDFENMSKEEFLAKYGKALRMATHIELKESDQIHEELKTIEQNCKNLKHLTIHPRGVIHMNGGNLINIPKNIQSLTLNKVNFNDSPVTKIEGLTELEDLNLSDISGTNNADFSKWISSHAKLKSLKLSSIHTIEELEGLDSLENLQSLTINLPITDKSLKTISQIGSLRSLYIENNSRITNEGLAELLKLYKLETLIIERCENITEEGVKPFRSRVKEVVLQKKKPTKQRLF